MKTICTMLSVFTLIVACSPKQVTTQSMIDHSETAKMIMNRHWLEADVAVVHNPDTALQDITFQFPAPERDDVLILSEDGTYQYDEGAKGAGRWMNQNVSCSLWQMAQQINMR